MDWPLNLPILPLLAGHERILIAGAGGGFDIFVGLPLYLALRQLGKTVHLANFSFTEPGLARAVSDTDALAPGILGVQGAVRVPLDYYPEGYLAQWLAEQGDPATVWMFERSGVLGLRRAYEALLARHPVDALLLVDGGVDSLMRGDEEGPGTLMEDTVSLAAVATLPLPFKGLACLGFGTEVEEALCHHHALENIAALAQQGAFWGTCSLLPQMSVFQQYAAACRYAFTQTPSAHKSHISTRIIPAVEGQFGDFRMYPADQTHPSLISPLMGMYWFFDAAAVMSSSELAPLLAQTQTWEDVRSVAFSYLLRTRHKRPRQSLPY
jgi:hypothetical protein